MGYNFFEPNLLPSWDAAGVVLGPAFFLTLVSVAWLGALAVSRVGTSGWNWFVALVWMASVAVQLLTAVLIGLHESGGRL